MKVVLDTNVLLTCISKRSSIHDIFLGFIEEKYTLCVTTDILAEYEEVITNHMGKNAASNVLQAIENAPNVLYVNRYYAWQIIEKDPDDNKFVDCAIAANGKYIVTGDHYFDEFKTYDYFKISVVTAHDFQKILTTII
jgi:uncharacterized protein